MIEENNLPKVGTPDEALKKRTEGYKQFLDTAAKFRTIAEYYSDEKNGGQDLSPEFTKNFIFNRQKIESLSDEDLIATLESYTLLELSYFDDVKENLADYRRLVEEGPDENATPYDQACDYLAVKDTFTDINDTFYDVCRARRYDRRARTNFGDPDYDLVAKQEQEVKE